MYRYDDIVWIEQIFYIPYYYTRIRAREEQGKRHHPAAFAASPTLTITTSAKTSTIYPTKDSEGNYVATVTVGIEAYTGDLNAEETTLTLNKLEQTTLPKNTAVIVRSKKSTGNFTFDFSAENSSALLSTNSLQGETEETAFTALAETGKTVLTLGIKDGVVAFRKPAATSLKANRVYLQVTTPSEGSSAKSVSMVINEGETNGITEVRAEKADSNTPLYYLQRSRLLLLG